MKLALELIRKYLPEGVLSRIYLDEQPKEAASTLAVLWRWKPVM